MKKLILLLLLTSTLPAAAHDFWLEPSTYTPARSSTVKVRLRVGERFLGDAIPRPATAKLIRFDALTAAGVAPITGVEGDDPAGSVTIAADGLVLLSYNNRPAFVEINEETLKQYFREEGLESFHAVRARSPWAKTPWKEIYSRSAKSLLWTGRGPATSFDRILGLPLELIPEKNPYAMRPGATLPVRLLYRGKPLKGALVVFISRKSPSKQIAVRSDATGRARAVLPEAGQWLVKAVHMTAAPAGAKGQWESFWASLTFELPR